MWGIPETQGGGKSRGARLSLPWATLWLPLRGEFPRPPPPRMAFVPKDEPSWCSWKSVQTCVGFIGRRTFRWLPDYRENERLDGKNPPRESTGIRTMILIEKPTSEAFHRTRLVRGAKSYDGIGTFQHFQRDRLVNSTWARGNLVR